ncbi:MAG TPA: PepSY domain-containing protein, partial [Xanthomonadaceae bacterium]|nr:PepSY domain-containing protein [Xanthomonadaceae bacterium]
MTVRNAIFQVHWLLGITAGVVLALVGATGAMLSFEDAILERLNPGVLRVEARGEPLAPVQLVDRVRAQRSDDAIASLTLSADPGGVARVAFEPKGDGGGRGERRTLDPYTGELLPAARGEGFFRTTMQLHRWLAADDVGKQVVAASTVALVFFCLSGLYLRWPRGRASLHAWFALDWKQRGRAFLWRLHAVVGTWVLLAYLVMALSGLWWS